MYLRVSSTPNSPRRAVKVVESERVGLKVKQRIVHHVGIAHSEEEIEKLKKIGLEYIARTQHEAALASGQLELLPLSMEERVAALESTIFTDAPKRGRKPRLRLEEVIPASEVRLSDIVESERVIEGIHEAGGEVYRRLGYNQIFEKPSDRTLLKDLVLDRLAMPASKHKTQRVLEKQFGRSHDLDRIYRLLDRLHGKIDLIKRRTFEKTRALMPEKADIVFFDVKTLYFESVEADKLRAYGYSKDHRFNTTQLVLALATNSDGLPIGYELFSGNTVEVRTLIAALDSWKEQFEIGFVCFVADRAMMSKDNIALLEARGYQYVIAAKLRALPAALQQQIHDEKRDAPEVFWEDFGWVGTFDYGGKRLIVSYKKAHAYEDARNRGKSVEKIQNCIGKKGDTTKLISNQAVRNTSTSDAETTLDQDKIAVDAEWDGLHAVITNIKDTDAVSLLQRYAKLWVIEESFRLNKQTLSMRPIYHFKKERIEAHIALCYLTFAVLRHLQYHVNLTQKISPELIIEELLSVQASIFVHTKTFHKYRLPGAFSQNASKIYKSLNLSRSHHAEPYLK